MEAMGFRYTWFCGGKDADVLAAPENAEEAGKILFEKRLARSKKKVKVPTTLEAAGLPDNISLS